MLVPCPSCSRHVRSEERACPFCTSALPTNLSARAVPAATRRLERLAAFTFAATLAITGCVAEGGEETEDQESEIGSIMPMYGLPPIQVDAGTPDTGTSDGGSADGGVKDGGSADGATDGGAPTTDAGPFPSHDAGGFMPMYGLPPSND